jgi:hypothetical protein
LFVELQGLWRQAVHVLLMKPLGMPTGHPQQTGDSFFRDLHEPCRGPDATAFIQMVDDVLSGGFWKLGIEQGSATALGELFPAGATAQQADTVMAIHLPDDEVVGSGAAKQLAFGIDTG